MELKAKATYRAPSFDLFEGMTTVDVEVSEEQKAQMLADFPDTFEVLGDAKPAIKREGLVIETKEDLLIIEPKELVAEKPKAKRK